MAEEMDLEVDANDVISASLEADEEPLHFNERGQVTFGATLKDYDLLQPLSGGGSSKKRTHAERNKDRLCSHDEIGRDGEPAPAPHVTQVSPSPQNAPLNASPAPVYLPPTSCRKFASALEDMESANRAYVSMPLSGSVLEDPSELVDSFRSLRLDRDAELLGRSPQKLIQMGLEKSAQAAVLWTHAAYAFEEMSETTKQLIQENRELLRKLNEVQESLRQAKEQKAEVLREKAGIQTSFEMLQEEVARIKSQLSSVEVEKAAWLDEKLKLEKEIAEEKAKHQERILLKINEYILRMSIYMKELHLRGESGAWSEEQVQMQRRKYERTFGKPYTPPTGGSRAPVPRSEHGGGPAGSSASGENVSISSVGSNSEAGTSLPTGTQGGGADYVIALQSSHPSSHRPSP